MDWDKFCVEKQSQLEKSLSIGDRIEFSFLTYGREEDGGEFVLDGIAVIKRFCGQFVEVRVESFYKKEGQVFKSRSKTWKKALIHIPLSHSPKCCVRCCIIRKL